MTKIIFYKHVEDEKSYFQKIMGLCKKFKLGVVDKDLPLISNLSLIENIALPVSYHTGITLKEVMLKSESLIKEYELQDKIHFRKNQLNNFEEFIVKYISSYLYEPIFFVFFNPLQNLFGYHRKKFYDFLSSENTEKFVIIENTDFKELFDKNIKYEAVLFEEWVTRDLKG